MKPNKPGLVTGPILKIIVSPYLLGGYELANFSFHYTKLDFGANC